LHWLTHAWNVAFAFWTQVASARAFENPLPASTIAALSARTPPNRLIMILLCFGEPELNDAASICVSSSPKGT